MIFQFTCQDCGWVFDREINDAKDLEDKHCVKCGGNNVAYILIKLGCGGCPKEGSCTSCGSEQKEDSTEETKS